MKFRLLSSPREIAATRKVLSKLAGHNQRDMEAAISEKAAYGISIFQGKELDKN